MYSALPIGLKFSICLFKMKERYFFVTLLTSISDNSETLSCLLAPTDYVP